MTWLLAFGVLEGLAEDHIAAALAVYGLCPGERRKSVEKPAGRCNPARVKLGITAGQPAAVAIRRRRLVVQRRKTDDLGALPAPVRRHVRVDEREGIVVGKRDSLAGRIERTGGGDIGFLRGIAFVERRPGEGFDPVEVDGLFDLIGKGGDLFRQIAPLACLNQAEMPVLKREVRPPRHPAQQGNAGSGQSFRGRPQMAFAGDPVQI